MGKLPLEQNREQRMGYRALHVGVQVNPTKHTANTQMVSIQNPPKRTHDDTPLASAGCGEEAKCPLCGKGPDTYEHVHQCVALDEIKREIEKETKVSAGAWEHATLFFRKRIDGAISP